MDYDPGFDSDFGAADDGNVFYSVPTDHPAFRGPEDNEDDGGFIDRDITEFRGSDSYDAAILELPVGRYDGVSRQSEHESSELSGTGDSRQRAADREFLARQLEQRQRDEGSRSIREHAVARQYPTGTRKGEGISGGSEPTQTLHSQLAASLEQAGIHFVGSTSDDRASVEAYINSSPEAKTNGGFRRADTPPTPLFRDTRGITTIPKFQSAQLTGMMGGLKSNVAGTWILTLHIDTESYDEVMKLAMAHGLALDISIKRKSRE